MLNRRFSRNTAGRDYLVGDIHGAYSALWAHLMMIGFNPAVDRLFCTGDLVDRGPESDQVLDWLAQPWFASVRGNHESMCMSVATGNMLELSHYMDGGGWFLDLSRDERTKYAAAFAELPITIELETAEGLVGIVHAECPVPDWAELLPVLEGENGAQAIRVCTWARRRFQRGTVAHIAGVRAVVVGHHALPKWTQLGNFVCIDTCGAYEWGHFTVLDAATLGPAHILGMLAPDTVASPQEK